MLSIYNHFTAMVQRVGELNRGVESAPDDIAAFGAACVCMDIVVEGYHRHLAELCVEFGIWPDEYNTRLAAMTTPKWACQAGYAIFNEEGVYLSLEKMARTANNGCFAVSSRSVSRRRCASRV